MQKQVAVLIPAYNEGPRIGQVLDTVCAFKEQPRIVVIDDGSEDDTSVQARRYPVELIKHTVNRGKGAALQSGLEHVGSADYWLFLDADLIGLTCHHMQALLAPLRVDSRAAMTVGMLQGRKTNVNLAQRFFGILNGQRALTGCYAASLPDIAWSRFGIEIFLSRLARARGLDVAYPVLPQLTHYTKEEKLGFGPGVRYRMQMYKECLYALFFWQRFVTLDMSKPSF